MMIDVSELMHDPDFAFNYTVLRTTGKWVKGRFVPDPPTKRTYYGPVQPASPKEIEQLSTGDQPVGVMKFFCKLPNQLYLTRDLSKVESEDDGAVSDVIQFRGCTYTIIRVMPWGHYGWLRAFATMKEGILWQPST